MKKRNVKKISGKKIKKISSYKTVKVNVNKSLYWSPRIFALAFALFIGLFALDSFKGGFNFETFVRFLIHLIPSLVIITFLMIAWKWELIGGLLFTILGILYIYMAWGEFSFIVYFLMSGPLFLIGLLFLFSGFLKRK